MAKYIQNVGGKLKEAVPLVATTGAPDASKIIQTGTDGRIDISLMPTGVAAEVSLAIASEAISAGSFVSLYNNAGVLNVRNADASVNNKPADGFVLASVSNGGTATVYGLSTKNTGLSALAIGTEYFLSATTPGSITATAPTGSGQIVQLLGKAESATALVYSDRTYFELA